MLIQFKCQNCGVPKESRNTLGKFCSNKCQHEKLREEKTALWLKTGKLEIAETTKYVKTRDFVKAYILKEQEFKCKLCQIIEWQGKPLVLILDHIDGNSDNNARENLRLVCPNCDSQLPTFKNRNKGKGRFSRKQRYTSLKSY